MLLVVTSVPDQETGEKIACALVAEKLGGCFHILPPHVAVYEWGGEICRDTECNLLIKTTEDKYPELEVRLTALHPFDVPMIYAVKTDYVSSPYAAWLHKVLEGKK